MSHTPAITRWVVLALWPVLAVLAVRAGRPLLREPTEPVSPAGRQLVSLSHTPVRVLSIPPFRNPFRVDRRLSIGPSRQLVLAPSSEPPPKPLTVPSLTGVVWGRVPTAVVEGVVGTDGPVTLREGDRVFGIRVDRILRNSIVLIGKDTTWRLQLAPNGNPTP